MAVNLDRPAGFDVTDPDEIAELAEALGDGVVLVIHPCGGVWQFEGGTMSGGNMRLVDKPRSSVLDVLDKFHITDSGPAEIRRADAAH